MNVTPPQTPRALVLTAAFALAMPLTAAAQRGITLPRASPAASVSQTIGLTRIDITYHRPAVKERKIWGGLVPYGTPWRAGANDNTTIAFSHPVKIEGKDLAPGTYGLHMIPTEGDWTLAFSRNSTSWGSFSYAQEEDALRVTVTPREAPFEERLSYGFTDIEEGSATALLRWDKLEVPFRITTDTTELVIANARNELRHLPGFDWPGWSQIAQYAEEHDIYNDEALGWIDRSLRRDENFGNLNVKSRLLAKAGKTDEAAAARTRALEIASEAELNVEGYRLMQAGDNDGALALFRRNADAHPKSWNVLDSLAEGLNATGDTKGARKYYEKALEMAPDNQKDRIRSILKGLEAS